MRANYWTNVRQQWPLLKQKMINWRLISGNLGADLLLGLMLLLILMSSGCAWLRTAPPATSRELVSCYIPQKELAPTQVPPLSQGTNGQLLQEANDSRDAIASCNRDKADALNLLLLQNKKRAS